MDAKNKVTWIGYIIGAVLTFSSYYRWFIKYSDPSNAYFGIGIGLLVIAITFLFERQKYLLIKFDDLEEYLQDKNEN